MVFCLVDFCCQGVNFYDDGVDEGCVMMKDWEFLVLGSVSFGINMMLFVLIKKC